ncbi:MAG: IS607 family transposase [Stigonema ocellatum SAG 48.90 = DSM 106950]|nr:IS607 family transposase [Stigonema ocellatum SAG 48.90 = DSM 106950]
MSKNSDRFVTIGEASKLKGVSIDTLRRWEKEGKICAERTDGGHRRYKLSQLLDIKDERVRKTILYCRVSTHDQKKDLDIQSELLETYALPFNWDCETIKDMGSGLNYKKKGLQKLIELLMTDQVERLVITDKDRLLRFGYELIFSICEYQQVEVIILNKRVDTGFEEDLAKDVLEIITVFSARLYGSRSRRNLHLLEKLQAA